MDKSAIEDMAREKERDVLTESMNRFEDGENGDGADLERGGVNIGVSGDGYLVSGVDVLIVGWPSETDPTEGAIDIVVSRKDIEDLNVGHFLRDTVWGEGEMLCESEEGAEFGDLSTGAGVRRVGTGNENVILLWRSRSAEGRRRKDALKGALEGS